MDRTGDQANPDWSADGGHLALRKNGNVLLVLVTLHVVAEVNTRSWKVVKTFDTGALSDEIAVNYP